MGNMKFKKKNFFHHRLSFKTGFSHIEFYFVLQINIDHFCEIGTWKFELIFNKSWTSRDKMGFDEPLPADADVYRERTLTGKIALVVLVVMIVFVTTSFVTTNWLEGDPKFYGTKFEKLGLWVHCFRSLPDYNDLKHERFYAGCRWIFNPFTEGYAEIRTYIVPRKSICEDLNISVILENSFIIYNLKKRWLVSEHGYLFH